MRWRTIGHYPTLASYQRSWRKVLPIDCILIFNKLVHQILFSPHKKLHSTETALLKIHNDIVSSRDKGKVTALTLLDLSAAFDTIDHSTLLSRLESWFCISGTALGWLTSYLTDRHQHIKLNGFLSPVLASHSAFHMAPSLAHFYLCCTQHL